MQAYGQTKTLQSEIFVPSVVHDSLLGKKPKAQICLCSNGKTCLAYLGAEDHMLLEHVFLESRNVEMVLLQQPNIHLDFWSPDMMMVSGRETVDTRNYDVLVCTKYVYPKDYCNRTWN